MAYPVSFEDTIVSLLSRIHGRKGANKDKPSSVVFHDVAMEMESNMEIQPHHIV